jgi:hypothetical protein
LQNDYGDKAGSITGITAFITGITGCCRMYKRVHVYYGGRVQGVGFRMTAER